MFSSTSFPQLPFSTNGFSPPNSFFYHENDDIRYNSSGEFHFQAYKSSATPPVLENPTGIDQDFVCQHQFSENHSELLDSVISGYKKTMVTSKKDGHSKIYTAQGPRDRRVRLSIEIARKFFCLQELLGFDKASETLDWLFSKSLAAIKELVEETSCSSCTLITDESKLTFLETINAGSEKKAVPNSKKKKTTRRSKSGFHEDFARDQSRTEARARARERTREKLRAKKLDDDDTFVRDCCESGNFWAPTEPKIDYKDITWECIMDQEASTQSNDSRFQINMISRAASKNFERINVRRIAIS